MNVTKHALMRMAQREYGDFIINDDTFRTWQRTHEDKIPELEKEILDLFNKSTIRMESVDKKGKISKYVINKDAKWVFVHDDQNIVTCYKLQYGGVSEKASEIILDALLDEYSGKKPKVDSIESEFDNKNNTYNEVINDIDNQIHLLNKQIEVLNQQKKFEKESLELEKIKVDNAKFELSLLIDKIVKPNNFL